MILIVIHGSSFVNILVLKNNIFGDVCVDISLKEPVLKTRNHVTEMELLQKIIRVIL